MNNWLRTNEDYVVRRAFRQAKYGLIRWKR
jgi:hypothetical protein